MKFDRRLVIMITNFNGTRHINVDVVFKKVVAYILTFILTSVVFVIVGIFVLKHEIAQTHNKKDILTNKFMDMQSNNEGLNITLDEVKEKIALIGNQYIDIENSLSSGGNDIMQDSDDFGDYEDIPTSLDSRTSSLIRRIDTTSITALQRTFIMQFIPQGKPLHISLHISGQYGRRFHPILNIYHVHTGIDISAPLNTSVYATADGVVDWANDGDNGGYGKLIKISHSFGFRTYYAHLNNIKVQRGQFVKKGQLIGLTGSTGRSTGPHLHYEVRFLGQPINPLNFVEWDIQNFSSIFEKERRIAWDSLLLIINKLMAKSKREEQLQ